MIKQRAQLSPDPIAWEETPEGRRTRLWCKVCRDQGKPWILGETCSHVRNARERRFLPRKIAEATLAAFRRK